MRIIRFDSVGGASGDMILGALIGLGADPAVLERELRSFIPEPFHFETQTKQSHAISGITLSVEIEAPSDDSGPENGDSPSGHDHSRHFGHDHCHDSRHDPRHHHDDDGVDNAHDVEHRPDEGNSGDHPHSHSGHSHRSFADIRRMIEKSSLSEGVKTDSVAIFAALAQAEGAIHSKNPDEVTFHEVGATDSIVDIVGTVLAFHWLNIDGISVSPIPIGSGSVRCAHGVYPIPAPATLALIKEFSLPVSLDGEECEMLTPTGALLLGFWKKVLPESFSDAVIVKTVHSLGHHEMKFRPNLLRATLYETSDNAPAAEADSGGANGEKSETLICFEANIDDASGEILGAAVRKIFDVGALDVWLTPIIMKKGRPGHLLGVLTPPENRETVLEEIFRQTGTFGVREEKIVRHALARRWETVETEFGPVRVKIGSRNGVDLHFAPEFDDCQKRAEKSGASASEVYRGAVYALGATRKGTDHDRK